MMLDQPPPSPSFCFVVYSWEARCVSLKAFPWERFCGYAELQEGCAKEKSL